MKPFKWIKEHPLEAAALAAGAYFGGSALLGAMGGGAAGASTVAGDAFLPGLLAGSGEAAVGGIGAGAGVGSLLGDFGTGMGVGGAEVSTPGIGAYLTGGEKVGLANQATKPLLTAQQSILLGQMAGSMGGEPQPMGSPPDLLPPMAQRQLASQAEITKAWLLKNDPATYARMYGPPPGAQGGMYG